MILSNYLFLKLKSDYKFSHFQIISPANLVIRDRLDEYVAKYDVVMRAPAPAANGWVWQPQASSDGSYEKFRSNTGLGEPLCARVDGLAVAEPLFSELVTRLLQFYSINDLRDINPIYPQEETIIPTFLDRYKTVAYKFGESCAKTFEPNEGRA